MLETDNQLQSSVLPTTDRLDLNEPSLNAVSLPNKLLRIRQNINCAAQANVGLNRHRTAEACIAYHLAVQAYVVQNRHRPAKACIA